MNGDLVGHYELPLIAELGGQAIFRFAFRPRDSEAPRRFRHQLPRRDDCDRFAVSYDLGTGRSLIMKIPAVPFVLSEIAIARSRIA
jgi:hypothetical protein